MLVCLVTFEHRPLRCALVSQMRIEDLQRALVAPAGPFAALDVVSSTGSTNADLMDAAGTGAPDRTVLIADEQTAGRGRRSREWVSPAGSGLYLSVLLRPDGVPAARLGSLAVVAALALLRTARAAGVSAAAVKWPNDLLAGDGKVAGVLSEAAPGGDAVVVGIGLNVAPLPVEVPAGAGDLAATSLADAGATMSDRTELAVELLTRFAELESDWRKAGGDLAEAGLLAEYREGCVTIGQRVRVELSGRELTGGASDVDASGELVVTTEDGSQTTVTAGDVVHLRG
jgi:BirA family biotin operon repressor/biotin-[acetyl-CoA-carboxylase] ligase